MFAPRPLVTFAVLSCVGAWALWSAAVADRTVPADRDGPQAGGRRTQVASEPQVSPSESLADLCRERAERLPQQLDQPCRSVVRPPFVLAGDLSEAELQVKFEQAVQPACQALLANYFRRLPDRPVLILMFRTEGAYRGAAEQLFFDREVSRFGYYKPGRQTILVNLAAGDGALFHELTHVLLDADFPDAPRWLQEGLATLHETSEIRGAGPGDGAGSSAGPAAAGPSAAAPHEFSLAPLPNWRGAILQRARNEGWLPSVRQFVTAARFRGADEALDYASARYFCLFLYQRGVLGRYYAALRECAEADPTGERTLLRVLAARDGASVDVAFRAWLGDIDGEPS